MLPTEEHSFASKPRGRPRTSKKGKSAPAVLPADLAANSSSLVPEEPEEPAFAHMLPRVKHSVASKPSGRPRTSKKGKSAPAVDSPAPKTQDVSKLFVRLPDL